MEQALQYLLSYLGNTVYKIEPSTEKDIFFVELNDNTTIDEISKKIASIKDVEIINGLVLKQPFEALGLDADESNRRGKQTMKIKSNITNFFESEDTAAAGTKLRDRGFVLINDKTKKYDVYWHDKPILIGYETYKDAEKARKLFKQGTASSASGTIEEGGKIPITAFDEAWAQWRAGGGSASEDFDKWLVENPIGKQYLIKIANEIKQMRENASYGTTIPKKFDVPIWQEGLYYLKLNNLIRDGFNKTMKIKGYFQEGIRVIENTDFPLADQKTIDIPFNILFDFIDSGRFKIGNVVYENERDKNLLGNEINSIKELFKMANTEAEKAQIAIELANTEAEKAQIETSYKDHILNMEKSTEKIKQDFSDTLGGMEALGGGRTATGKNIKYKISNEQLNYLVDKLNRNEKAKYKDLLFEFSKGEAWAREKAHYNLYIYTDKGFKKLYNESISKNALKSVLRNWFELVYGGSMAGGGREAEKWIVFYSSKETGGMRERHFTDKSEADTFAKSVNSEAIKMNHGGSMAKGGKVQPKDEYTDILYGGFYIVTDIKKHPVHGDIVILKDRNTGDEIQKKYEDMLKISGNKQDHNNPNFQFLRTGKKGTLNEESIEKTRQERLELQFKEDPEHAYHRTGTYYPIKGVHYAKGGSMAGGGKIPDDIYWTLYSLDRRLVDVGLNVKSISKGGSYLLTVGEAKEGTDNRHKGFEYVITKQDVGTDERKVWDYLNERKGASISVREMESGGSMAEGGIFHPTNQYIWGHGEILESYPSDIGGSNASVEHIIEFEGKKYIVNTNQDENEVLYANKTAREIDNIASGQYAVGGRITEGERRAVSKKNENLKIVLQELRRKVPNFKKLSNPMATTIAQLVLDYGDDDFKIKDITIKENENQSLSLYVKGKDWRGRSFYDSWYDQQMYPQRFGSMVGGGRAEGESEKEKESKINGTKTKRSSQIIKINKKDKFWHARVISPKGAKSCAVPEWATIIASGVHEGAKVTTGKMGDNEWHVQKVMVPVKGINKKEAKSISEQIVSKINKK